MNKQDVITFFDRCAPWWDADMIRNEEIIAAILHNAGVREGIDVLDVACGTGVLFPDYLSRGVASLTGIDISPEMAKLAAAKFPQAKVVCDDVEAAEFDRQFDVVMVYNAFPHFPNPARLIRTLAGHTKPGGKLSIAHGMSRSALIRHHERASQVSIDLLEIRDLAALIEPYFTVDVLISDDRMYQIVGTRRDETQPAHGHTHPHDHGEAPADEMLALMKYMVGHNEAHCQELTDLAMQLRGAGNDRAYRAVMDAVTDFDMANAKLDAVLKELHRSLEEM